MSEAKKNLAKTKSTHCSLLQSAPGRSARFPSITAQHSLHGAAEVQSRLKTLTGLELCNRTCFRAPSRPCPRYTQARLVMAFLSSPLLLLLIIIILSICIAARKAAPRSPSGEER